ncbi:MAG: ComF family protein [Rikenellaceae bacterium]
MSTLSKIFAPIISLIWRRSCAVCGCDLEDYEEFLCIDCTIRMPRTNFHKLPNNPMAERLRSLSPAINHAAALFHFYQKSDWQSFIHSVKYYNGWRSGYLMGYHYGRELSNEAIYSDIDVVIPVPLHPIRRMKRGYNQSEYIAQGIAKALGVKLQRHALRRLRNNPSQTKHATYERWHNVDALFALNKRLLRGTTHILLVDDVFTTGATISSCIETITSTLPDVRISVVTLALAARQFRFKA